VGGFILEPLLFADSLEGNVTFAGGRPHRRVRAVGVDVDADIHILAKANMLLHLAEAVRDPATTTTALNLAMADTFVLMNDNETLGSLLHPPRNAVDVILTNPPYVTQGSAIYKKELGEVKGPQNGLDLRDYYEGSGLGVEALFLRYVSGSLKPGGRAFVIVPLGLLNRTEPGPKVKLLEECNVLASIQLPRNTFFNTSQKTYILVLEKRHTAADPRPDVLCGIARSIGETLDWQRIPTPDDNDLSEIAALFVRNAAGDRTWAASATVARLVPAKSFGADDRWDVTRFWTDEELVDLGERESPVDRLTFISEATESLKEIGEDLALAQSELESLVATTNVRTVSLKDAKVFTVRSGTRVRGQDIRGHDGDVPIYSCFKEARLVKGRVDEAWLKSRGIRIEERPLVTVNANGASVGRVYVRLDRCVLTDDVIAVEVLEPGIDLEFLAIQLRGAVAAGGFLYEAKLFTTRVRELIVEIPVQDDGSFDLGRQRTIAAAVRRFDGIRERLAELGERSAAVRIA